MNGQTKQYTANALNQYETSMHPGAIDVVGEADPVATVEVNAQIAARQDKFYHKQLPVLNSTSAVYEHLTVEVDDGITSTVTEDDVYVPQESISYSYDDDGNLLSDGRWMYTWDGENRLIGIDDRIGA